MVKLKIDGRPVEIRKGATILEAATAAGVRIPTLCHIKDLFPSGACRLCVVETGSKLLPACSFPAAEGMCISTRSPRVLNARRTIIELLLASHPFDCLTCNRNGSCELQALAAEYNIQNVPYRGERREAAIDFSSPSIVRNPNKCLLCGRCVRVCEEIQGVAAVDFTCRGFNTIVLPAFNQDLSLTACVNCGQCLLACPTGALHEVSEVDRVVAALQEGKKTMIAAAAPAIRVSLGDFYGLPAGANVTGRIAVALRRVGFQHVFDTDFTADLTIMEEGSELLRRLAGQGPLPLFTSCCPAWIKYVEQNHPDRLANLSTCRSPQAMMGSLIKNHLAEKWSRKRGDLFVVSIMPCTAKKYEAKRPELGRGGVPDVDAVLTTREFARLLNYFGVDFKTLPEGEFDYVMGTTTGSGDIFAASGGVTESALRTVYHLVTGQDLEHVDFKDVRGYQGVKRASVAIGGSTIKVAVVNTLASAARLLEALGRGEEELHLVEVMACPGGCAGGGGQIFGLEPQRTQARLRSIYALDKTRKVRQSYRNERVNALYSQHLGQPGSPLAHELLHTHYHKRPKR